MIFWIKLETVKKQTSNQIHGLGWDMAKKSTKKMAKVDTKKSTKKTVVAAKKGAEVKKSTAKVSASLSKSASKKKITDRPKPAAKSVAKPTTPKAKPSVVAKAAAKVQPIQAEKMKVEVPAPEKPKLKILSGKKAGTSKKAKSAKGASETELTLSSNNTKWLQLYKKYGNLEATNYDMTKTFEEKKPIQHPKLGWGFIVTIQNDRLEVLFQEGTKTLISNYNPDLKL